LQLVSHHWSLTADETAWHSCTTGAEKPLAEPTRKANARAIIMPKQREVAQRGRARLRARYGMPAVPRARDVFKMTMCLVGLCACGLLYRVQGPVQGNQILLLAAFYAVAWWALGFVAPPPARLPIRVVLWSLFASFYLVENSRVLVPVVAVLLDLACRLLLRTLPRLAAAEAASRASKHSASDASSPIPSRKKAAALPTKKKAD
jgi:hypothetical protein